MTAAKGPAYIHPQGALPDGLWFDRSMVENLLARDVIDHCTDCEDRYPEDDTFMVVGGSETDEEDRNVNIVLLYEVPAPTG